MNTLKKNNPLTRKDLIRETGAKHYTISYLTLTDRLPMVRRADGPGQPNLYHLDCIPIVKDWIKKGEVTR